MDQCSECGSSQVRVFLRDGLPLAECELCGALLGDNEAALRARSDREARELGVDPEVWPLVQALGRLPGLRILRSHGGDVEARTLPFVQWLAVDALGLQQLDKLTRWLALSSRNHRLGWVLQVDYVQGLVFTLKPRLDPERLDAAGVAAARADLDRLHLDLERHVRLSWWQKASAD